MHTVYRRQRGKEWMPDLALCSCRLSRLRLTLTGASMALRRWSSYRLTKSSLRSWYSWDEVIVTDQRSYKQSETGDDGCQDTNCVVTCRLYKTLLIQIRNPFSNGIGTSQQALWTFTLWPALCRAPTSAPPVRPPPVNVPYLRIRCVYPRPGGIRQRIALVLLQEGFVSL